MDAAIVHNPPISITDLALLKAKGATITVENTFEINEVDLVHEKNPYRAFLFFFAFFRAPLMVNPMNSGSVMPVDAPTICAHTYPRRS